MKEWWNKANQNTIINACLLQSERLKICRYNFAHKFVALRLSALAHGGLLAGLWSPTMEWLRGGATEAVATYTKWASWGDGEGLEKPWGCREGRGGREGRIEKCERSWEVEGGDLWGEESEIASPGEVSIFVSPSLEVVCKNYVFCFLDQSSCVLVKFVKETRLVEVRFSRVSCDGLDTQRSSMKRLPPPTVSSYPRCRSGVWISFQASIQSKQTQLGWLQWRCTPELVDSLSLPTHYEKTVLRMKN